mgnify:FL=1
MPLVRIEAIEDPATGRFGLAIHVPPDAERPFVTTPPRYASAAAAETDAIAIIASLASLGPERSGRG